MDVYKEWEFISNIPENSKPCFNDKTFTNLDEWFVTIRRRYKGEKGEKGVIHLEKLIETTKFYKKDKELLNLLEKSINGIHNLSETYRKDNQIKVSENYKKCIQKVKDIISGVEKGKKFFSYIPKVINE
jgi:predicted RNA-binding protein with EMAP domain